MQVPSTTSFSVDLLWTLTQTECSAQKNKMDCLGVGRGLNKLRSLGALSKAKHMGLKKKHGGRRFLHKTKWTARPKEKPFILS